MHECYCILQSTYHLRTATNLSNSYQNDMLTVKVIGITEYALAGSFHVYKEVSCTLYLVFMHFLQKGPCNSTQFKNSYCQTKRLVDWCAVMTLESFSCVICQSKEFDRVTDWLKHSLQASVVYVKYLFMFQNDYKRLGHSVICSIDYWLLYVNRKFKWYELSGSEMS
jgi:hypothetical protein